MQVIVVASQKGGAGKTTLAYHLAVEAERQGRGPVAMIDADPQGSLTTWWKKRKAEAPSLVSCPVPALPAGLAQLRANGCRYVIVDTPPAISGTIRDVVRLSDQVLVPCRPSPLDLDAVGGTIDLVEGLGKPLVFVVNQATRRARLTGQAAIKLSQHGTAAPSTIHYSVAFSGTAIQG